MRLRRLLIIILKLSIAIDSEDTSNQINVLKEVPRFFNDVDNEEIGKLSLLRK
jgi:hypothetical protein